MAADRQTSWPGHDLRPSRIPGMRVCGLLAWTCRGDKPQIGDDGIDIGIGECHWRHLLLRPSAHGSWIADQVLETCIGKICDCRHRLTEVGAKGTLAGAQEAMTRQALHEVDRLTAPRRAIHRHAGPDLTTRQGEKLIELRDDAESHASWRGLSVRILVEKCSLARDELEPPDAAFVQKLQGCGATAVKRRQLFHLLRCARQLKLIEPHMVATKG